MTRRRQIAVISHTIVQCCLHRNRTKPPLRTALRLRTKTHIDWVSPSKNDDYAEYSDEAFLKKVGVKPAVKPLSDFWPKRGPQWDALATLPDGGVILVEAKAQVEVRD